MRAHFVGIVVTACLALAALSASGCVGDENKIDASSSTDSPRMKGNKMQTATFGGGCFWCVEAIFQRMEGVEKVVSGYMGGHVPNPTYEMICTGQTGHAEVCQVTYDPEKTAFVDLLEVFWKTHDPTTLNRQGNDIGSQYRSAVFYHDDKQRELAEQYKKKLDESGTFDAPIVTEITQASTFYDGESNHQNYFNLNENKNPYCQMIRMKVDKFKKVFPDKVKKDPATKP